MKALICDICGGKLVMQSGGVARCESCGMEYTKERVQEKVQEVKGTIKVDGPVETVKGDAEKGRLLSLALECRVKKQFDDAKRVYEQIISEYPTDWQGYFGLIVCTEVNNTKILLNKQYYHELYMEEEYQKALTYAPEEKKGLIEQNREKRYKYIKEQIRISNENMQKIKLLYKAHDYMFCFREVMRQHVKGLDIDCIEGYLNDCISWHDDEYSFVIRAGYIDIPPDKMSIFEKEAIKLYNSYIEKHLCPACHCHYKLNIFGRCKICGKVKQL